MRINVYAEELTHDIEVVTKSPENHPNETFYGVRLYLESPDALHGSKEDDDRTAITFWVPWTKRDGNNFEFLARVFRELLLETEDAKVRGTNNA